MNPPVLPSDADLVRGALMGQREAFELIVARYQRLICTVAYSGTGCLRDSEDIAQETFVAAWRQLGRLEEPDKLRFWLCGIARNLIHNTRRRHSREPSHAPTGAEFIGENPAPDPLPVDYAITAEEQSILWRSLEKIPELYREPLILFYREHESVAAVATQLDLSVDTVKQRLSRGRKLLAGEVAAFVAGTLQRTNPGKAFTLGVLAALPLTAATSAKAATVAVAAAKTGAAATGITFLSVLGILAGPALGLAGGLFGMRCSLKGARTERERSMLIRFSKHILLGAMIFSFSLTAYAIWLIPHFRQAPSLILGLGLGLTGGYALFVLVYAWRLGSQFYQVRQEEMRRYPELFRQPSPAQTWQPFEYRSQATCLGLPLVHIRYGRQPGQPWFQPAIGWIAIGEVSFGILFSSGALAFGGFSMGGLACGILSLGGCAVGLLSFGGVALGGVAFGGMALGWVASGGLAVAWHAGLGGLAVAHDLALGGEAIARHANDEVARAFYLAHPWLDITRPASRMLFWLICFLPVMVQGPLFFGIRKHLRNQVAASVGGV